MKKQPVQLDDEALEVLLEEVCGRGPSRDLAEVTLRRFASEQRVDRQTKELPGRSRARWHAPALMAFGASVVVAVWLGFASPFAASDQPSDQPSTPSRATAGEPAGWTPLQDPSLQPEQLVKLLGDEASWRSAAAKLRKVGAPAVGALAAAVDDEEASLPIRERALGVLESLGPAGAAGLPAITALIERSNRWHPLMIGAYRAAATLAPYASREAGEAARDAIVFMNVGKPARNNAATGRNGLRLDALGQHSNHECVRIHHRLEIARDAETELLVSLLADESPYRRELAAELLGGRSSVAVKEALRAALLAEHPQSAECDTLCAKTGQTKRIQLLAARAPLDSVPADNDARIRSAAARSLARVARGEPVGALAFVHLLEQGGPRDRATAVSTLAHTEVHTRDEAAVLRALRQVLASGDSPLLADAVVALGQVGSAEEAMRPAVEALAKNPDPRVAQCAASVLRRWSLEVMVYPVEDLGEAGLAPLLPWMRAFAGSARAVEVRGPMIVVETDEAVHAQVRELLAWARTNKVYQPLELLVTIHELSGGGEALLALAASAGPVLTSRYSVTELLRQAQDIDGVGLVIHPPQRGAAGPIAPSPDGARLSVGEGLGIGVVVGATKLEGDAFVAKTWTPESPCEAMKVGQTLVVQDASRGRLLLVRFDEAKLCH